MCKDYLNELFDCMDDFRHLPDYQLERRADLFFYLYLPRILKNKQIITVQEPIIPEFPIKIDIINEEKPASNHSIKIDYFAISIDLKKAVFVELKTDDNSIKPKQSKNLHEASNNNLKTLIEGVITIAEHSSNKRKYLCLLNRLNKIGLFDQMPEKLNEIRKNKTLHGMKSELDKIIIKPELGGLKPEPVYILPSNNGNRFENIKVITFDDFLSETKRHHDPVSKRFATSLQNWIANEAGMENNAK